MVAARAQLRGSALHHVASPSDVARALDAPYHRQVARAAAGGRAGRGADGVLLVLGRLASLTRHEMRGRAGSTTAEARPPTPASARGVKAAARVMRRQSKGEEEDTALTLAMRLGIASACQLAAATVTVDDEVSVASSGAAIVDSAPVEAFDFVAPARAAAGPRPRTTSLFMPVTDRGQAAPGDCGGSGGGGRVLGVLEYSIPSLVVPVSPATLCRLSWLADVAGLALAHVLRCVGCVSVGDAAALFGDAFSAACCVFDTCHEWNVCLRAVSLFVLPCRNADVLVHVRSGGEVRRREAATRAVSRLFPLIGAVAGGAPFDAAAIASECVRARRVCMGAGGAGGVGDTYHKYEFFVAWFYLVARLFDLCCKYIWYLVFLTDSARAQTTSRSRWVPSA